MNTDVKELDSLPRKFLFDERHDIEEAAKEQAKQEKQAQAEEAKRATIELQEAELKKTYDAGYALGAKNGYLEGYKTGWTEAQVQCLEAAKNHADQHSAQALEIIANRVLEASQHMNASYEAAQKAAVSVAVVMARKLAEKALEATPDEDIAAMITDVLSHMDAEKRLLLKVNPHIMEALQPKLEVLAQAAGFHGTIEVRGVPELAPTDARLTWQEGGAQRIFDHLAAQIEDVIARHFNTENMTEDPVDVPGVLEPQDLNDANGMEDVPQQAVTEFVFTGEAPIPTVPIEITEAGEIPLPESLTDAPAPVQSNEDMEKSDDGTALPEAAADEAAPTDQKASEPKMADLTQTGSLAIHEFSDDMPPPKKAGFESIDMNQFEQLDDEA